MESLVRTFVEGLDEQMKGGIPRGHIVLLSGTPGTMKSSLAYSILYHNALQGDLRGAYLSLEQPRATLLAQMEKMGMAIDRVKERLAVYDITQTRRETEDFGLKKSWTYILQSILEDAKRTLELNLLVLDSVNVYEVMAVERDVRVELFEFFSWLKGLGVTTFVVSEMSMDSREFGTRGLGFLADGILHLKDDPVDEIHSQRRIKCVKMRGVDHSTDYFSLLYRDGKFRVMKALLK